MDDLDRIKQIVDSMHYSCPVCGSALYVTDYGKGSLTFHCASEEAKFWAFRQGSKGLAEAKGHWDASIRTVEVDRH
ncbi:MAG TPA: hypothetical protein VGM89_02810 [Puia sp.]